jgi:hypothetical protein
MKWAHSLRNWGHNPLKVRKFPAAAVLLDAVNCSITMLPVTQSIKSLRQTLNTARNFWLCRMRMYKQGRIDPPHPLAAHLHKSMHVSALCCIIIFMRFFRRLLCYLHELGTADTDAGRVLS